MSHLPIHLPSECTLIRADSCGPGSDSCTRCRCGYAGNSGSISLDSHVKRGDDVPWDHRDHAHSDAVPSESHPHPEGLPLRHIRCDVDGCKHAPFRSKTDLTAHQEGSSHYAIPYYCPLTAEHCCRSPCPFILGSGDALVGRQALRSHLFYYHKGHVGSASGLDLSWVGLAKYRIPDFYDNLGKSALGVASTQQGVARG